MPTAVAESRRPPAHLTPVAPPAMDVAGSQSKRPLELVPGVVRLFGVSDIRQDGLADGWALPEEGHTWNDGYEAVLLLVMPTDERPAEADLLLEGEPYITRALPAQDLTLYANGWHAGFWRMTERNQVLLRARIEPEWWRLRGARTLLRLTFHLPGGMRPVEIGDGQDSRRLAFCFRTICLIDAPA